MSDHNDNRAKSSADYQLPEGPFRLAGPIARPAAGALPLRGDLAHIALVGTHLAAHYVIPNKGLVGASDVTLKHTPADDGEGHVTLPAGTAVEVLDEAGDWVWLCCGPAGPAGYCRASALV